MTTSPNELTRLLDPQSIAIIGASDNPDKIGGRPIFYMKRHGYRGELYPVNSQRTQVQGQRCWPSLGDLPAVPDLAIIAVAGQQAVDAVNDCAARGVGAAIIIAAGFGETGAAGMAQQEAMTRTARQAGMRLVGPNSQGLANFGNGAIASFSTMFLEVPPADGSISVISQSGGMSAMIYGLLRQRGLGVRHMHATGNECDLTVADLACAALADPEIRIVLAYLESLQHTDALIEAARLAHERNVPLAVVKGGRSPIGQRAAASHTGALANEDRAVDAFFERHGIVRLNDPQSLARYAELAVKRHSRAGRRLAVVSNSGASCVLASDAASDHGLEIVALAASTQKELAARLPGFATTDNPVDITAALLSNNRLFGEVLPIIGRDAAADMLLVDIPVAGRGYDVGSFAADTAAFAAESGKPVAVVAWQEDVAAAFRAVGVPAYPDEQQAASAMASLAAHHEMLARPAANWPSARAVVLPPGDTPFLSEAQSLALLSAHGLPVVAHHVCADAEAVVAAWRALGRPVALKACSAHLPHKSEHGLVALGIDDEPALRDAVARQRETLAKLGTPFDGWIVAAMQPAQCEFTVGAHIDRVFGPIVVIGGGGKYVEALNDVAVLAPPFTEEEVIRKLRGLRMAPVLAGVRGDPPADVPALAALTVRLGQLAVAGAATLASIEMNPVRVGALGQGVVAVDALIERAAPRPAPLAVSDQDAHHV